MEKLYVVVRSDLPPGDQAVQSVHAALQYARDHRDWTAWSDSSNCLALLAVADEKELQDLLNRAADRGLKSSYFREPDLGHSMTAVALEPGMAASRLCRKLRKALSEMHDSVP